MAQSLFHFRGKGEWVRDGVAEFWFRALIDRPAFKDSGVPWVKEFVHEVQDAVDTHWMMVLIDTGFNKYLVNEERISFMTKEVLELHKELREMGDGVEIVYFLGDQIYSDSLMWVMNAIENLLLHPENLSITARDLG